MLHTNLKLLRLLICQQQITSFEDNVELKRSSQSDEGSQADSNNFLQIVAKRKPVQSWSGYHMPPPHHHQHHLPTSTTADALYTSHSEINIQQVPYDQGWEPGGALVTKNRGREVVEEEGDGGGGDYGAGFDLIQG